MAFSKARRLSDFIAADGTIPTAKFASGTITSDHIADTSITHADLHTDMNLTSKTVLVANASTGDSDTTAANTAFVQQEIAALVDSSPSALNTLNELAAALGDDENFSTTVNASIAAKLPLAGGTMTGPITMSQSGALHNQFTSTGGSSKISIISADGEQAYINYSGATNEMSAGYDRTSSSFRFANGDTLSSAIRMQINSAGNVGIGTTDPKRPLQIGATGSFPISFNGNYPDIHMNTYYESGWKIHTAGFGAKTTFNGATGAFGFSNIDSTQTAGANFTPIERLTILANGRVGIGTDNPRYNLAVAGDHTTAVGIALDNASGSSTLDIAALGTGYNSHGAGAGEVWFFSPDNINIGGATGHTNDIKFLANNSVNMIIKGATGRVGIGVTGPTANLQINGSTDAGGGTQNVLIKNTTTASYSSTAFVGTGRVLDFITNSNNNQDFSAIRFTNPGGSRETAIAVVADQTTTQDGTLQGDVVIQGYDGDGYIETQRFRANGSSSSTGQRRTGGHTSFAYINHTYTFDHAGYPTAGTPSNSNDHWLEVPLYSNYSSSAGGGWVEIDICWHATHAQAGHLHSYKLLWGSNHGRILNVSVISSSANATAGSYNPYAFTSSSQLFRHPTAGDAYMTKMYIQIKGSTNHSGGRSITLRGVGHPSVKNIAPVIDHGSDSTPDGITPANITSAITATG